VPNKAVVTENLSNPREKPSYFNTPLNILYHSKNLSTPREKSNYTKI